MPFCKGSDSVIQDQKRLQLMKASWVQLKKKIRHLMGLEGKGALERSIPFIRMSQNTWPP
jgi:hypothetical protein